MKKMKDNMQQHERNPSPTWFHAHPIHIHQPVYTTSCFLFTETLFQLQYLLAEVIFDDHNLNTG